MEKKYEARDGNDETYPAFVIEVGPKGRDLGVVYDLIESRREADRIAEVLNDGVGPDWDTVSDELDRRFGKRRKR